MEPAEATGTRARPRRCGGADGGYRPPDLLSALPDSLLHVIMSSLKARQAVQTCVLSTRWRDLWRSVPCLDIDLAEFRAAPAADRNGSGGDQAAHDADVEYMYDRTGSASSDDGSDVEMSDSDHESSSSEEEEEDMEMSGSDHESSGSEEDDDEEEEDSSSSEEEEESSSSSSSSSDGYSDDNGNDDDDDHDYDNKTKGKEWEDFADFTTNLMSRCNIAQLDSFRLHIGRRSAPWSTSYRQATRWLHRAMKYCTPVATSNQRKGCLSSRSWRLRRLHLSRVHLDGRFAEHVTSVCHSLENLELHDCRCQIRSVSSGSLKTLVLRNCKWHNLSEITSPTLQTLVIDGGSNYPNTCLLVVSAPVLEYLHLNVNVRVYRGGISLNGTPSSLSKASIHLYRHRDSEGMSKLGGDQLKLLCSVSNVTSLKLSGAGFLVLRYRPTFQEFRNLRNLVLANCDLWDDDLHILAFFLRSSPNLEKLTLRRCKFPKYSKKRLRKLKRKASSEFCGMDFDHENLNVEIIYKNGDAHQLGKIVKCALGNLSKSCIKLTKVS